MNLICSLLVVLLSFSAEAEYRAYRLGVRYHPEDKTEPEVEVISNLDDLQYESYYKITLQQQTRIIRHWMCWGRTDYEKEFCPEPPLDKSTNIRQPAQVAAPQSPPSVIK